MRSKKLAASILSAVMAFGCLTGCGDKGVESNHGTTAEAVDVQSQGESDASTGDVTKEPEGESMKIVTTIFPEYDWVKTILGDNADNCELTLLLDNGVDLHSYQPTAEDIVKIQDCDMFVYVGGESDGWVQDVLSTSKNDDMVVVNLLEVLGDAVKEEEIVEGMEHEHEDGDEDHDHEHEDADEEHEHEDADEDHDHEHEEEEEELDEHVWLSLRNATVICEELATDLGKIDEANKDVYMQNYEVYKDDLEKLDSEYKDAVDAGRVKTVLFADRFPFRYLVDDYGLDYYAAFAGCSAESEADFETIIFLSGKVDELGLSSIMTIEGPEHKIADTVKDNTKSKDQNILSMDSMQSTTSKDIEEGTTYLSVMESNLETLKEALK